MNQVRRAIGILTSIVVVCAGAVVLQTRAADERHPAVANPAKAATNGGGAGAARASHRETAAAPPSAQPGAPQVPEESATIRDDPTIAPDPKQSADNNVSFPNDI